ncbi:hypothetical protein [Bauldia litoralis]|uniref:hypothetical protein n=1 Tax=Bauldia litoralis TaxID=665467 RepID=UPI00326330D9
MVQSYLSLFMKSAYLAFEAQQVMALRMMRIAGGGKLAEREMRRMVAEKASAGTEVGMEMVMGFATGKSGTAVTHRAIRDYRSRVHKNRRRLSP